MSLIVVEPDDYKPPYQGVFSDKIVTDTALAFIYGTAIGLVTLVEKYLINPAKDIKMRVDKSNRKRSEGALEGRVLGYG